MIYLDYNATTPLDPHVLNEMKPYFNEKFGNAASKSHHFGIESKKAVLQARKIISKNINAKTNELVFTSGATESINLGIIGSVLGSTKDHKKIITSSIEHKAVLDTCNFVKQFGVEIVYLSVDSMGFINPADFEKVIDGDVILVVLQHVNNEIGTIQQINELGAISAKFKIPFMVDAAQSLGKLTIDVKKSNITYLAASSHKIYGPKGVGVFYKDSTSDAKLQPIMHGGGHEGGIRSGTLNVPGIVGFGKAIDIAGESMLNEEKRLTNLSKQCIKVLKEEGIDFTINGSEDSRIAGNLNLCFDGVDADWIILHTPEIAISTGSACTSETIEPSHVLRSLGLKDENLNSSVRLSFGRFTTKEEIKKASYLLANSVKEFLKKREKIFN